MNMTIEKVKEIVKSEHLRDANICEDRPPSPNEVILRRIDNKWIVAAADERAAIVESSIMVFDNEKEACEDFIWRLRCSNEADNLLKEIFHY